MWEEEKPSTGLQEQLHLASEKLSSKDAEIKAFKAESVANSKLFQQLYNEAKGLQTRFASLAEIQAQSNRELESLKVRNENIKDQIAALCCRVGTTETARTSPLDRGALLEGTVFLRNNIPPLPITRSNAATKSKDLIEFDENRQEETNVQTSNSTHKGKVSSRGSEILSDSRSPPSEVDLISTSVAHETVPCLQIEANRQGRPISSHSPMGNDESSIPPNQSVQAKEHTKAVKPNRGQPPSHASIRLYPSK